MSWDIIEKGFLGDASSSVLKQSAKALSLLSSFSLVFWLGGSQPIHGKAHEAPKTRCAAECAPKTSQHLLAS